MRDRGRPPVRRLRRRRADHRPAGDGAPAAAGAERDRPDAAGPAGAAAREAAPRAASGDRSRSAAFGAKRALARTVGRLSRLSGRGGGTTLPGPDAAATAPRRAQRLGASLSGGSTLISATNGKTTTAGMIAAALEADGRRPSTTGRARTWPGAWRPRCSKQRGSEGLFEVDEAWLPKVSAELHPRLLVLANLFRDQLDRYGELERLADEWAEVADRGAEGEGAGMVLNADDPLIADLGRDRALERREGVTYFGIEDPSQALAELQHAHDAKHCRRCGAPYRYERAFVGHLGHYSCTNCGADRPSPTSPRTRSRCSAWRARASACARPRARPRSSCRCPASTTSTTRSARSPPARGLGVPIDASSPPLGAVEAVFGRVETIEVAGQPLSILLIKNPAGANEVLRTLAQEARARSGRPDRRLARAQRPDRRRPRRLLDLGRRLRAARRARRHDHLRRHPRGRDGAAAQVRGLARRTGSRSARDRRLARPRPRPRPEGGRVFALPTYTALIELRTLLSRRGLAKEFWQ